MCKYLLRYNDQGWDYNIKNSIKFELRWRLFFSFSAQDHFGKNNNEKKSLIFSHVCRFYAELYWWNIDIHYLHLLNTEMTHINSS